MPDPALNSTWKANAKPIITTVRIKVKTRTPNRIMNEYYYISNWIFGMDESDWIIIIRIGSLEWMNLIGSSFFLA